MTVWQPVIKSVGTTSLQGWQVTWGPMAMGDTAAPISSAVAAAQNFGGGVFDPAGFSDRSVQCTGTFGANTPNIAWEGSNDGVNFYALTNPQGNALNFTAAGLMAVTEAVLSSGPVLTGGDGTTAITVTAFIRRTFQQPGFNA